MSGAGAVNLSLLSRGVGEVQRNGHEKVEVVLEPEDYYNFVEHQSQRYYLPPIRPRYAFPSTPPDVSRSARDFKEVQLPKTFTTRKGALLLFSEDFALRNKEGNEQGKSEHHRSADDISIKTVDDLAKSILSYGSEDFETADSSIFLQFAPHKRKVEKERRIRPGFSAKRYLATWTKVWDDSILNKLVDKGYITERSLFHYNPLQPKLKRPINDDLSHYPAPYRLMRQMLQSPGSLGGFTFYRVNTDYDSIGEEDDVEILEEPPKKEAKMEPPKQIHVVSTKEGVQKEVSYHNLDKETQKEVLTDLLVKSAIHHALQKQKEMIEASYTVDEFEKSDESRKSESVPEFDMKEAVESLLDSQKGKAVLDDNFPDEHKSVSTGSLKKRTLPKQPSKGYSVHTRSWPNSIERDDQSEKEYIGNVPVVSFRAGGSSVGSYHSSVPSLPALPAHQMGQQPLTPIKDVESPSRETSQFGLLPVIVGDQTGAMAVPKVAVGTKLGKPVSKSPTKKSTHMDVPEVNVMPPTPQQTSLAIDMTTADTKSTKKLSSKDSKESDAESVEMWGAAINEEEILKQESKEPSVIAKADSDDEKSKQNIVNIDLQGPIVSGGSQLHSSSESLHSSVMSTPKRSLKGSKAPSIRSIGSRNQLFDDENSEDEDSVDEVELQIEESEDEKLQDEVGSLKSRKSESLKGSVILAPDGKVISVGGSVAGSKEELNLENLDQAQDGSPRSGTGAQDSSRTSDSEEPSPWKQNQFSPPALSPRSFDSRKPTKDVDLKGGDVNATLSLKSQSLHGSSKHSVGTASESKSVISVPRMDLDSVTEEKSKGSGSLTDTSALTDEEEKNRIDRGDAIESESESHEKDDQKLRVAPSATSASSAKKSGSGVASRASSVKTVKSTKSVALDEQGRKVVKKLPSSKSSAKLSAKSSARSQKQLRSGARSGKSCLEVAEEGLELSEELKRQVFGDESSDDLGGMDSDFDDIPRTPEFDSISENPSSMMSAQASSFSGSARNSNKDSESSITEQEVVSVITEHAQKIAENILSQGDAGQDLETDIRQAAGLWMEEHPPRKIVRSQSMKELDSVAIDEIMKARKRNSAGPSAAEYRELIKRQLTSAVAKASGLDVNAFPPDTEVSDEVIYALQNEKFSPSDLEVATDETTGKTVIRPKRGLSRRMSSVKPGHLFIPPSKAQDAEKPTPSIPHDRMSNKDVGEMDILNYVVPEPETMMEKAQSVKSRSSSGSKEREPRHAQSGKSQVAFKNDVEEGDTVSQEDDFQKAVENLEKEGIVESPTKADRKMSMKSSKSAKSSKSVASNKTEASGKSGASGKSPDTKSRSSDKSPRRASKAIEDRDEFVVGKVKQKGELEKLYGQIEPPPPPPEPKPEEKDHLEKTKSTPTPSVEDNSKLPETEPVKSKSKPIKPAQKPSKVVQGKKDDEDILKALYDKLGLTETGEPKPKEKPKPPPAKPKAKKGPAKPKAGKKKEAPVKKSPAPKTPKSEKQPTPPVPPETPKEKKPETPKEEEKPKSGRKSTDSEMDRTLTPKTEKTEDDDFEFEIVREREEDSPEPSPVPEAEPVKSLTARSEAPSTESEQDYESKTAVSEIQTLDISERHSDSEDDRPGRPKKSRDDASANMKQISNKEARAAKRAAQAQKRREEVERKRKEREEQIRKEKEEQERQQKLQEEMEEERKRREEERRLRKLKEAENQQKEEDMEKEREKRLQQEKEREKRQKEEYQKKLEEMKKKQIEEEKRRKEEMERKKREEEVRRREEEELMSRMEEEERLAYEMRKKFDEEQRIKKEEEERRLREEEANRAMLEAKRLAEEMARRQAELEARLKFNRSLQLEASGLEHSQDITQAFVYSYFELLQWLGLDIPEFELQKLAQYY